MLDKNGQKKVKTTEMDFLRRSLRKKYIINYAEERRVILYGHVRGIDPARWIAKVAKWNPTRRCKIGRPRRCDEVDEAMEQRAQET